MKVFVIAKTLLKYEIVLATCKEFEDCRGPISPSEPLYWAYFLLSLATKLLTVVLIATTRVLHSGVIYRLAAGILQSKAVELSDAVQPS